MLGDAKSLLFVLQDPGTTRARGLSVLSKTIA